VAETIRANNGLIKYRFNAPRHLLIAYERGENRDSATFIDGLPRSTPRNLARKITFVPANCEYAASYDSCAKHRVVHVYFNPAELDAEFDRGMANASLAPRLFFEDATLWHTILKLERLVESATPQDHAYFESLGAVLAHEVARLCHGAPTSAPQVRGGLAAWQQRVVASYIEEHHAERISLATLSNLIRLSPYHFCRSFKQTFGVPPRKYQIRRRIEHARLMLEQPYTSITDIALTLGFSSPNAFATIFRNATGSTPTAYHRQVAERTIEGGSKCTTLPAVSF
jgi:AraC family transcriptional regulator